MKFSIRIFSLLLTGTLLLCSCNLTQSGGGDAKLKTVGMDALFGFNISKYPAYQAYGREAAHHILYTVVNSAGMNGFVHGVEYVNGFAYYKIILIVWDILAAAGLALLTVRLVKRIRKHD